MFCFPSPLFQALLLGIGLQHKSVEQLEKEIELPSSQLMGLFNRLIRKFVQAGPRTRSDHRGHVIFNGE